MPISRGLYFICLIINYLIILTELYILKWTYNFDFI